MEESVDNCASEVAVLRRKLESKAEALLILTHELEQCRSERDQLKLLAEQQTCKKAAPRDDQVSKEKTVIFKESLNVRNSNFDHIFELREQNKTLKYEIQDLKQKLKEAYGDIKVLRANTLEGYRLGLVKEVTPAHHCEELVEQLEKMSIRVSQLETDLHSVLDEKEELVTERESYRCKVHRLNHQINTLLKIDTHKVIDIDALIMDNKYLQEQMQQLQVEKELAQQALVKYKNMLEKRRNKGIVKLGSNSSPMVVTHKQVQELLQGTPADMPNTEATLEDLRSLCQALLEALQDKSLALAHQKKANKILASRISELEHRLGTNVPVFLSELLLQGYSSCNVVTDLDKIVDEPIKSRSIEKSETAKVPCSYTSFINLSVDSESGMAVDNLPDDIQELVTKALEEIHYENSNKS